MRFYLEDKKGYFVKKLLKLKSIFPTPALRSEGFLNRIPVAAHVTWVWIQFVKFVFMQNTVKFVV